MVAFEFKVETVAGAQPQFVADGFRDEHAAGAVDCRFDGHDWDSYMVIPICQMAVANEFEDFPGMRL